MKLMLVFFLTFCSFPAFAQPPATRDTLLDHFAGNWILTGTMDGKETTHDVSVEWVLAHQYLQMHETSREKDSSGNAAYEAIVYFGWVQESHQYGCLWLDITGVWSFTGQGIGRGIPNGNEIPFVFKANDTSSFRNTFVYDGTTDTWKWLMDDDENGTLKPFARVTLRRKG